ncbi:MAG: hypothetical protein HRU20_30660 [Pseudomonadales bacterium]|nr:hypothetical protein [Pseudomonadales bacterium]
MALFKRSKQTLVAIQGDKTTLPNDTEKELAARFASLFMICYRCRDISGMHVTLTAFTHTLHALGLWTNKAQIRDQMHSYIMLETFPVAEVKALDWLLNHYFELPNDGEETHLLNWYQSLDDEWILRKKLRDMFPDKTSSELTPLIAEETAKLD